MFADPTPGEIRNEEKLSSAVLMWTGPTRPTLITHKKQDRGIKSHNKKEGHASDQLGGLTQKC